MTGNTHELSIQGMHCGACVRRVSTALADLPGVEVESVTVGSATVRTRNEASTQDAIAAIHRIGFKVTLQS